MSSSTRDPTLLGVQRTGYRSRHREGGIGSVSLKFVSAVFLTSVFTVGSPSVQGLLRTVPLPPRVVVTSTHIPPPLSPHLTPFTLLSSTRIPKNSGRDPSESRFDDPGS